MSLPDVRVSVSDGLLGFATQTGTGISVAVGASPVESEKPVVITGNMSVALIRQRLGFCPLSDAVMDAVDNGANRIYCIPVQASIPGIVGEVMAEAESGAALEVSGEPYNACEVRVEITGKGDRNSALFSWTLDGAESGYGSLTVPLTGEYALPDTGLTLRFTGGSGEFPFQIGDAFTFSAQAPRMTNGDVLSALERLRYYSELYELVHIVGESTPAMWHAVSAAQTELEDDYDRPLAFVMEAGRMEAEETVEDYAFRLEEERKGLGNRAIQIVAARSLYTRMDGITREVNNAGIVMGLYARTAVHESIARPRDVYRMGIKKSRMMELRPVGIEEYTEVLDAAGYLTFREFDGLNDFYVTNARMMCPDGSDFRYMEDVRVLQKIQRGVREAGLPHLHEDIDMTDAQNEMEKLARHLETPLDNMRDAGEISDARVTVPEGQDITGSETMEVLVRYVSRGYVRIIAVDIGRTRAST